MTPERTAASRLRPEDEAEAVAGAEAAGEAGSRSPGRLLPFPAQPKEPSRQATQRHSRAYLLGELLVLFVGLPVALFFRAGGPLPVLPTLWAASAGAFLILLRDPTFDRRQLWNAEPLRGQMAPMLALFAVGVVLITVLIWQFAPAALLAMVRHHPRLWAYIMISYPFASVYPQAVIYRAFFFHRYEPLLGGPWVMVLVSAATFAFVHIIFHNWIAVALTFVGGLLFAWRYLQSRSLCVSFVEHTLYGWLMFTVGLGHYFLARVI